MAAAVVSVTGLTEIRGVLRRIADKDLTEQLKTTNRTAAQIVVDAALPNVPVGRTKRLKATVRALASQAMGRVIAGTARVDYAAAIHWGRKRGNVGSPPGNHPGPNVVAGRMFLWDAAESHHEQIAQQYATDIDHVMDAVRSSIARR